MKNKWRKQRRLRERAYPLERIARMLHEYEAVRIQGQYRMVQQQRPIAPGEVVEEVYVVPPQRERATRPIRVRVVAGTSSSSQRERDA